MAVGNVVKICSSTSCRPLHVAATQARSDLLEIVSPPGTGRLRIASRRAYRRVGPEIPPVHFDRGMAVAFPSQLRGNEPGFGRSRAELEL
jgi:hypothetical protein